MCADIPRHCYNGGAVYEEEEISCLVSSLLFHEGKHQLGWCLYVMSSAKRCLGSFYTLNPFNTSDDYSRWQKHALNA